MATDASSAPDSLTGGLEEKAAKAREQARKYEQEAETLKNLLDGVEKTTLLIAEISRQLGILSQHLTGPRVIERDEQGRPAIIKPMDLH